MSAFLPRLRRPRTLLAAARAGVRLYRRERDLIGVKKGGDLISNLLSAEEQCEAERRAASPAYSVNRHVRLLTALLAEARAAQKPAKDSAADRAAPVRLSVALPPRRAAA